STVLPSRVEVTVKPVSLRPASADETATTPASSTSASKRLRGVIFCLLAEGARTAGIVGAGCRRNVEIASQKCFAQRVEFSVLGPLEVRIDGRALPLGGPKQRALLALLLLNGNEVVSRDRLLDSL